MLRRKEKSIFFFSMWTCPIFNLDKYNEMQSPWQTKHEDGGDDENDVEGCESNQKAIDGTLHLWPGNTNANTNAIRNTNTNANKNANANANPNWKCKCIKNIVHKC